MLSRRGAVINLLGFAIGLALFGWIVARAVEGGDWSRLLTARPWHLLLLLGGTVVSMLATGTTFWATVRPLKPLRFTDLQLINIVASVLNYLPLRMGAITRVVYHVRVDGMSLLQLGAWFAMVFYVLALGVGSCVLATLARETIDLGWLLLVLGQMVLGGVLTLALVGHPIIVRYGQGIDRLLSDHFALWTALGLRLIDIGAYCVRMAAALLILEIELPWSDIVILSLVAMMASLIPFGRLGFREFCVAVAAQRLSAAGAGVEVPWEQLALVESAGEALIFVPAGALGLIWLKRAFARSA